MIRKIRTFYFFIQRLVLVFSKSQYDTYIIHLGTNSLVISLLFVVCFYHAYQLDLINWIYLRGLSQELSFFIGITSILLGSIFYSFWRLHAKSLYDFHLAKNLSLPDKAITLFNYQGLNVGIGRNLNDNTLEMPIILRKFLCVASFFLLLLMTIDNRGLNSLVDLPQSWFTPSSEFCDEEDKELEKIQPKEGCALIIRAYKLGYAKDLGYCEPDTEIIKNLEICEKRQFDEPYLHYMSRLIYRSFKNLKEIINNNEIETIEKKFKIQLKEVDVLKAYQAYAMSSAPRASHHIWTNLPHPQHKFFYFFQKWLNPSSCIDYFQNLTNTHSIDVNDHRKYSKLLQHVYGHLLFNPKIDITVGFCKEYTIHWNASLDTCKKLATSPTAILKEYGILSEIDFILKRHQVTESVSRLDETFAKLKIQTINHQNQSNTMTKKKVIDTRKISKSQSNLRPKDQLISFQCFMQNDIQSSLNQNIKEELSFYLKDIEFSVTNNIFNLPNDSGKLQVAMYRQLASLLEKNFNYTQYSSRSDLNIKSEENLGGFESDNELFDKEDYILSRLESLNNIDIFLGNDWVLMRDDLLEVYPFHVHLENYIERFRIEYDKNHGRL